MQLQHIKAVVFDLDGTLVDSALDFAAMCDDIGWPHGGLIDIIQGEDMGSPSRLRAEIPQQPGSSIRVSGMARRL